jgi:hypothetical protein
MATGVQEIEAFLESVLDAKAHQELGDAAARIALFFADRARSHWAAARARLDDAERSARELAAEFHEDPDAWPPTLEHEIRAAIEARDEREAG